MGYRNVVVGTDGSETARLPCATPPGWPRRSAPASPWSPRIRRDRGPQPMPSEVPDELQWMITDVAGAEEHAQRRPSAARPSGGGRPAACGKGDPAEMLVDVAEDTGGDLIVVGSKGMASASRFVLGSVPNKVSHHALAT